MSSELDLAEQLAAAVRFGAPERLLQQRQRLEPGGDLLRTIDDFADADDDGDAVFGGGGRSWSLFLFRFRCRVQSSSCEERRLASRHGEAMSGQTIASLRSHDGR